MEKLDAKLGDRQNAYTAVLEKERRKKILRYFIGLVLIIVCCLLGLLDVKAFSGISFFGLLLVIYDMTVWEAIYHISIHEKGITFYILDFFGKKNEINLNQRGVKQLKFNHSFLSIKIPQYDLQLPLGEKKFNDLIAAIEKMNKQTKEMNLSERASRYLKSLTRDTKWTADEEETKLYLRGQHLNSIDEFLRFQVDYSGYELTIKNHPKESFRTSLFSKEQICKNEKLELEKVGDRFLEICGDHKTAQFSFFITDKGEICTLDNDDLVNVVYSSFDKMLEVYALRNEIYNWASNPHYFEIQKTDELVEFMNKAFQLIVECSDSYSTWWQNESLIAVKAVWLDRAESYFHVYGKKENDCHNLIQELQRIEILK